MSRIVVAMSGGVDSSVAAALLQEQGHEVIGIMLRLWSEPGVIEDDGVERVVQNKCCSLESVDDARRVARLLDIPFYLVNVEQEFKNTVVDMFYEEYVAGRTPNPCLTCNRHIRFTVLLNRALALVYQSPENASKAFELSASNGGADAAIARGDTAGTCGGHRGGATRQSRR